MTGNSEKMAEHNWLESRLQQHLGPATAPAGLWAKVRNPPASRAESGPNRLLWPAIALLMFLASADLLWEFTKARGGFHELRLRQIAQPEAVELAALASAAEACDLYSSDPVRIRQWVKSRSGIEIELPPHSPSARIVGARVTSVRGTLVATLKYETVGDSSDRGGAVLVWKSGKPGGGKHVPPGIVAGSDMLSWSQGENVFAAIPAEGASAREACLLCHPEGTHGI